MCERLEIASCWRNHALRQLAVENALNVSTAIGRSYITSIMGFSAT
jgi:hypothetical protein